MKIKIITACSFALLLISSACTKDFDKLNTRSNLVTEDLVNVDLILTNVEVSSIVNGPNGMGTIGNYCGFSYSGANRPFASGDAPGVWNAAYGSYVNNLSEIIRLTQKDPDLVNKTAIARILKVWAFTKVTDTYGDIPYFESCLPLDNAVYHPKYDAQQNVYQDFFKELKEAAAQLDESKPSYGSADLIYNGDPVKWKKLANSLRLRLALRIRYADATMAADNMSDLTEADLITSIDDDAYINTSTDYQEHQNNLYNSLYNRGYPHPDHHMAKTLLDLLKDNNDPRIGIYADTAMATFPKDNPNVDYFGYRGHPLLGLVPVQEKYPYGFESVSRNAPFWWVPVIERPLLRCSEVYFALAEAALFNIKGTPADANAYYQKGIDAGIEWAQAFYDKCKPQMLGVNKLYYSQLHPDWNSDDNNSWLAYKKMKQADIDAFKTSPAYTLSGSPEEQLEQIIDQKMITLFPLEYQGWAEWRRTGYPRVLVGDDHDDLNGVSPRRMMYPNFEETVNSKNFAEAISRFPGGKDDELARCWWDANTAAPHQHPGKVEWMDTTWVSTRK